MPNIQIKDIPDDVHKRLKSFCAAHHISIKDFIIELIRKEIDKNGNH